MFTHSWRSSRQHLLALFFTSTTDAPAFACCRSLGDGLRPLARRRRTCHRGDVWRFHPCHVWQTFHSPLTMTN